MFNVGDTVEWMDDDDGELKKGHRYTVSGQENECVFLGEVALGVHESCIRLVKPAAFKAGDRVRCIEGVGGGFGPQTGSEYTILAVDGDEDGQLVGLVGVDHRPGWCPSRFELVESNVPPSLDIESLARHVHQMACEKGWWEDGKRNFGELMALATSEISEAFEEYRNGHKPDEIYYGDKGKPEGVPVELADCIIRILDTCEAEGIPLARALREKIAYNATRPHRHGGKVC